MDISNPNIDFAFPFSKEQKKKDFRLLAKKFLKSKSYVEMERYGRLLMLNAFKQHGKSEEIGPMLDVLNNYEFYFDYRFRSKQKVHFSHLTNVFLLGLYLYHKSPKIKECFEKANRIESTVNLKVQRGSKKTLNKYWDYSGGSIFMEFLYRWRFTALSHDIGIPIQQAEGNLIKIGEHLEEFGAVTGIRLNSIDEILSFKSKFLNYVFSESVKVYDPTFKTELRHTNLEYLDKKIQSISLLEYMKLQQIYPNKGEIFHDHGIFGALVFLILINKSFQKNDKKPRTTKSFWHPYLFQTSIIKIAKAIAMHNLNQNEEVLKKSLTIKSDLQFIDLEREPIAWLLKISDLLQIWDKPRIKSFNKLINPNSLSINF
ncbi:hypothetical protein LCGC14_2940500, partial [marine sediment metagenome]